MKLSTKVSGLVYVLLAILTIGSLASVTYMWHLVRSQDGNVREASESVVTLAALSQSLLQEQQVLAAFFISEEEFQDERWKSVKVDFEERLSGTLLEHPDREDYPRLASIKSSLDAYIDARDTLIEAFQGGRYEEARRLWREPLRPTFEDLLQTSREVEQEGRSEMRSALEAAKEHRRQLSTLSLFCLVSGWIVGLILLALLFRRIFRPLGRIFGFLEKRSGADVKANDVEGLYRFILELPEEPPEEHHRRLASLGLSFTKVSHDMRNQLQTFAMASRVLRERYPSSDAQELADRIEGETEKVYRLLSQILTYARPWETERRPCPLNPLVRAVAEKHREAAPSHVTLETELDPQDPTAVGDPTQVEQVVDNLVRNAIEAHGDRPGAVVVTTRSAGCVVEVTVSDTGPGIADGDLAGIFQPFRTTKSSGFGLGLAIAREVVESHGGTIRCESSAEGGALFTIRLPALVEENTAEAR